MLLSEWEAVCRHRRAGSYSGFYQYPTNILNYWDTQSQTTSSPRLAQILLSSSQVPCSIFATTFSGSARTPAHITWAYLLVFQIWTTSGSVIFLLSAWASRKSKKYLMATGALLLGKLQMLLKSFSTTEWIATWKVRKRTVLLLHKKLIGFLVSERWACPRATTHRNYNMLVANI